MRGGLRGAGDTRCPFYGGLLSTYAVRLPIAFLAHPAASLITTNQHVILGITIPSIYISRVSASASPQSMQ